MLGCSELGVSYFQEMKSEVIGQIISWRLQNMYRNGSKGKKSPILIMCPSLSDDLDVIVIAMGDS